MGAGDQEEDGPEAALAKLLADSGAEQGSYSRGSFGGSQTLLGIPSAQQLQVLLSRRLPTLSTKSSLCFREEHLRRTCNCSSFCCALPE